MSSVTGTLVNNTSLSVTITAGSASHGETPTILAATVEGGATKVIFVANSDGAGVEGTVNAKNGATAWTLHYDNPVVGSNSGSVDSPTGYNGSCQAGGGTDANFTYTIGKS